MSQPPRTGGAMPITSGTLARDLRQFAESANELARSLEGALAPLAKPEQSQTDMPLVLTPAEFADLLGVHPRTVQRMRAAGQGPKPIRVRGAVRYRRRDAEAWLEGKRS